MKQALLIAAIIIATIALTLLIRPGASKLIYRFKLQAPLLKKYRNLVTLYLIMVAVAYAVVWRYFYSDVNLNVLGQLVTILFAIFAGYIAFSEFSDKRYESNYKIGMEAFRAKNYKEALISLEACRAVKPKDKTLLLNMLELYAILGEEAKFDANVEICEKALVEDQDRLVWYYARATRYLLRQHIQETQEVLAELVEYVASKPRVRTRYSWGYKELMACDRYKELSASSKRIFKNYTDYLDSKLEPGDEAKFIAGDIEFTRTTSTA